MTRRIVAAASALALTAAACQLFVKIRDEDGVPAEADTGDAGADLCQHVRVPAPPVTVSDAGSLPPLFFAARTYAVLPPGERPGFDLDDRCTGDPRSTTNESACMRPGNAPKDTDYDGGVDNVFSYVMTQIPEPGDFAAHLLEENARKGFFTVVVQITDYNGEANDDLIKLSFITAGDPTCDGCDGGPPSFQPGADEWKFLGKEQQLAAGKNLAFASVLGYVTNGRVVVDRSGDLAFTLTSGSTIELIRATLTGTLQKEDGGFTLRDVSVGGTTPVEDVLRLVSNFELNHELLCGSSQAAYLTGEICKLRDLRAEDRRTDMPCDALSFAFRFDTVPARMSSDVRDPPQGCALPPPKCPD